MSQIRSIGTKPEAFVRKLIWSNGYRYRIGHGLKGKPDMVFPAYGVVVFIDGCFWHGCPRHCRMPSSNTAYWNQKISGNIARDIENTKELKKEGWKVVRIWEHSVKKDPKHALNRIIKHLR